MQIAPEIVSEFASENPTPDQVSTIIEPLTIDQVISSEIAPNVRAIDEKGFYPHRALKRLGSGGAFAHHTNHADMEGGLVRAISDMARVGETCLSSAFCMWCQDALAWYLVRSENQELRDRTLQQVSSGAQLGGTGLSNPMKALAGLEPLGLKGRRVAGGYRVRGKLPWVSNLGPDHIFASVFSLENGGNVMALFNCSDAEIKLHHNAKFIALEGTGTFTIGIKEVFVPDADIIAEDAVNFLPKIRQGFVLLQLGMAIGLARSAAHMMLEDKKGRETGAWLPIQPEDILVRAVRLEDKITQLANAQGDTSRAAFLEVLRARLEGSWLALDAAQAASIHAGAKGYLAGSTAFRKTREAQFVAIVTPSIKHITMELERG